MTKPFLLTALLSAALTLPPASLHAQTAPAGAPAYDPKALFSPALLTGRGLHWDELDEDLLVAGLLAGEQRQAA